MRECVVKYWIDCEIRVKTADCDVHFSYMVVEQMMRGLFQLANVSLQRRWE